MTAPTLRPGVLTLGEHFSGTFATYKARFWLFATLAFAPTVAILALYLVGFLAYLALFTLSTSISSQVGLAIGLGVVVAVGYLVAIAFSYRCLGMTALATRDLSAGYVPTWSNLMSRTRGFMGRIFLLILVGFALGLALYGIFFGMIWVALTSGDITSSSGGATVGIVILLSVLLVLGVIGAGIFLGTRWMYLIPVMAIEQASGFGGLRRSWGITRGAFWETLGFYIVISLAVALPSYVLTMLMQIGLTPLSFLPGALTPGAPDASGATALATGSIIVAALVLLLTIAGLTLLTPITTIFTAVMYISRTRKLAGEPPSVYFYRPVVPVAPPAPGYGPPPGYPPAPPAPPTPPAQPPLGWTPESQPPSETPPPDSSPWARPDSPQS